MIRAAIDLGSNTTKLLVARVGAGGRIERVLAERVVPTRSGQGIGGSRTLAPEAMARTLRVLGQLAGEARQLGAAEIRCGATSAVRDAENRAAFLAAVRQATGLDVRVLSCREEAALGYLGAVGGGAAARGRRVVLDIGGGSAQFTVGAGARIVWSRSYRLGAVRLTERYLPAAPAEAEDRRRLEAHVRRVLAAGPLRAVPPRLPLVGVGGTAVTLARLDRPGRLAAPGNLRAAEVSRARLSEILESLAGMSVEERRQMPGMDPARADIIVAGLTVLRAALDGLGREALTISWTGLRHGLIAATDFRGSCQVSG